MSLLRAAADNWMEIEERRNELAEQQETIAQPLERAAHKIAGATGIYSRSGSYPRFIGICHYDGEPEFEVEDRDDPTFTFSVSWDKLEDPQGTIDAQIAHEKELKRHRLEAELKLTQERLAEL